VFAVALPLLALIAVAAAGVLVLLVFLIVPRLRYRLLLCLRAGVRYTIHAEGAENLPRQGAALLVCNQLCSIDWLIVLLSSPRPIRFLLLDAPRDRLSRYLMRSAGAIALEQPGALDAAAEALKHGELVCIFAGRIRRASGEVINLAHVLQRLRGSVPIIPVAVNQRWGSQFLLEGNKVIVRPVIQRPYPVWVCFGPPLPADVDAGQAVQAIQRLSADIALNRRSLPAHRHFVRMASKHPLRPCLYDSSSRGPMLSYGKVLAGSMCLANHLRPLLGDTPMVALWLPPGAGGALSNIALALLGKTSVNLNYTSSPESIRSALRQCNVRYILTAKRFTSRVPLDPGPGVELIHLDELMPLITSGEKLRAFLKVLLLPRVILERWVLKLGSHSGQGVATIIFSSGSTGEPKGVMLSQRNVMANVESMIQVIGLNAHDRILGILPFFHSFGYTVTLWAPLLSGVSVVYHADPRQAKEIGELSKQHRCTIFLNTPTFLRFCLKRCEPDDFRDIRLLMCGAEKLPQSLVQEFHARFGILPLEGYGCTELSPAAAANTMDVTVPGGTILNNKTGTIGPPLPGVCARVVDPDTRQTLPTGRDGLVMIRGSNAMQGYLDRPELTASVLRDNEYCTGDMGHIDEDGYITLTGRLSRFAKIGGEMVPLEKVEEELHYLLETTERVLAVASVPDAKKGERLIVLHLQIQMSAIHLCRGLSERGLPNLWVPGERDFFPVPQLPLLGSGKLDLKGVKEIALSITSSQ
jgi:acyl-[acyl-carrier-protein]-phospholipid O-acyltransferase/long-chain-fatty-acid--[acyl-carrier-protein] ligase